MRATRSPRGATFSINTSAVSAAIHSMFMVPTTKRRSIKAQQHPRQDMPWWTPMRKPPPMPSRQLVMKNPMGERHRLRHAFFHGVHWNTPATINMTPPKARLSSFIAIGDITAVRSSVTCNAAAATLNTDQATT